MLNKRQQYIFVLSIPIINVIADSTQDYFQAGIASPGYIRALIILAFLIIHFQDYYKRNPINNTILISLIYFFILGFFSSDFLYSQSVFLKYFIASMMFPVGYYYFRTLDRFRDLLKSMMWVLIIFVLSLLISNIFLLGSSDYLEESVYFGSGRVNITKPMMILVLISPLALRLEQNPIVRRVYILTIVIAVIFVLIGVKRSAVLGLFLGYFIYYLLAPQKNRVTKRLFIFGLLLFLTAPLYYNTLVQRFEVRQESGRFDLSKASEEEGRVIEIREVLDAYRNGTLAYKLFGTELFNSMAYFTTNRMLHTDYATILAGAGLVGLSIFMLIYYLIFRRAYFLYKAFTKNSHLREIMAVSITLILAIMITGIAGTVTGVGFRAIAFMFWGASLSYLDQEMKILKSGRAFFFNHTLAKL